LCSVQHWYPVSAAPAGPAYHLRLAKEEDGTDISRGLAKYNTDCRSDGSVIVRSKDKDAKTLGRKFKLNAVTGDRFLLQQ